MQATTACGLQPFLRRLEVAERKQEREVVHDLEHAAEHQRQAEEGCGEERTGDGRADGGGKAAGNRCHACRCRAFGGVTTAMTKDVRVGTSICENADRSRRSPSATGRLEVNAAAMRQMLEGMWVNTIGFTSPNRFPRRAATG